MKLIRRFQIIRFLRSRFELAATVALLIALAGVAGFSTAVMAEQTREQCYDCCKSQGLDEYYSDQCRLKCFRNNDHCVGQQRKQPTAEAPAPAAKAQPAPTDPAAERPAPERPVAAERPQFRYPNPLNLVPGKEFEAAGQILAVNGIPPQHPQYAAGLKAVEQVLVQFARANPSGGRLPTAQLERILRQLR